MEDVEPHDRTFKFNQHSRHLDLMEAQHKQGIVAQVLLGGEGLVHAENGSVLVADVIAGESITYQLSPKRRGALRGECISIEQPSPHRIKPTCLVANDCGGCALQHISAAHQAALKTAWVHNNFTDFIQQDTQVIPAQSQQSTYAGRRRLRWFIDHQQARMGFYKRHSHQVISSQHCPAITAHLDDLRQALSQHIPSIPQHVQSIQAIELSNGIHLILESKLPMPDSFSIPAVPFDFPLQWWWKIQGTPSLKAIQKPALHLYDAIDLRPYSTNHISIQIAASDFIQGQQQGNQALITQILEWTKDDTFIVDLFSGCGNLSLPIAAAHGAQVVGAELSPCSVQAANHNAQRLKLNAKYHSVDLFGKFSFEPFIAADTLIIDPPRKGAKRICNMIQQFFPQQVVMIHCDPASGARDAQALQQAGFHLKAIRALDLFPFTGHVESVSLWRA